MKTITVDDSQPVVNMVLRHLRELYPESEHIGFTAAEEVAEYAENNSINVAFLDVEMPGMSGITLAKKLQSINPGTNIIFITGHEEYMRDAFSLYASGYLVKPVTKEDLKDAMEHLRYPVETKKQKRVRVQCFGSFETFVDGRPVHFGRSKSKELFAYLVDRRGAACTPEMIIGNIWPELPPTESLKTHLRVASHEMINAFGELGITGLIIRERNNMWLNTEMFDCDFYDYLAGDEKARNSFCGEYMTQYEFAEDTRAFLQNKNL